MEVYIEDGDWRLGIRDWRMGIGEGLRGKPLAVLRIGDLFHFLGCQFMIVLGIVSKRACD
jgi:hypothetical protein